MQSENGKVKVCFLITKGVWGGAQKYVYTLATSLPQDRYDVLVITGSGEILKNKLQQKGIRVEEIGALKRDISLLLELKSFIQIFKILKRERPSVIHTNSPKASGLGVLAGRLLGLRPIIQTIHGFTWNEKRGTLSKMLIGFISWFTIILSHKTIVIAPQEEREAKRLPFIPDEKIVLIRNGVEHIEFKSKEAAREELLSLIKTHVPEGPWIGTISELHKNKGLIYAIIALSKLHTPANFFIIGSGEEKSTLLKLIHERGVEDRVFLLGFVGHAEKYLKAFDIFTLTSIKEGLPYVLLEAGRAALPTVASSAGGIPDIVENGISGILTSKERPGEIARALDYLFDNPEQAAFFGQNLKNKIEKDFSIEHMLEETFELYKQF
jgi:glycosyltransferase involved in cell wall biosynthesis